MAHHGNRKIRVGDTVRFSYGTTEVVAHVIRDLGPVGVDGRQLVVVAVDPGEHGGGELREFDMPADELTVIHPAAA